MLATVVMAAWAPQTSPGTLTETTIASICTILKNLKLFMQAIAGGVAVLVIVVNGVKWIGSSDDPGARKQAKEGIIHAVVGLVIVIIAVEIVSLVYSKNCGTQVL